MASEIFSLGGKVAAVTGASRGIGAAMDVRDNSSIDASFEQILRTLSRIDILVNNAGVEEPCASLEVSEALWNRILDTNLKGAFFCAQAAARRMTDGGRSRSADSADSMISAAPPYFSAPTQPPTLRDRFCMSMAVT